VFSVFPRFRTLPLAPGADDVAVHGKDLRRLVEVGQWRPCAPFTGVIGRCQVDGMARGPSLGRLHLVTLGDSHQMNASEVWEGQW
jgi:hypothetical protein